KLINLILFPFSLLYGLITWIRNLLYNWQILTSEEFDIPVISIGNLSVGGTGKTPHIEYLVRLLSQTYHLAILSRGYKRKTKGFLFATNITQVDDVGDEPTQFAQKFPDIIVAVDEKRRHGIHTILSHYPDVELILLDDAFQHRAVKPGLSILLSDFHKLFTRNFMLPTGTLREFKRGARRANIIIVSKTPKVFSPILKKILIEEIRPKAHQQLFFSYIKYGCITPIPGIDKPAMVKKYYTILMVTGIANTYPLQEHLKKNCAELITLNFPDHHHYSVKNMQYIKKRFDDIFSKNKAIITTEKDLMRMNKPELISIISELPAYYIPIEIAIHKDGREAFNELIKNYVREAKANH
ncbi:tetraacyldisaccharide 4'-kinase, partial [Bacteroidota bacterium]